MDLLVGWPWQRKKSKEREGGVCATLAGVAARAGARGVEEEEGTAAAALPRYCLLRPRRRRRHLCLARRAP